jgi:hypothetical protein
MLAIDRVIREPLISDVLDAGLLHSQFDSSLKMKRRKKGIFAAS